MTLRSRSPSATRAGLLLALALAAGCASHPPEPVDPRELLDALRAVSLAAVTSAEVAAVTSTFDPRDGLTVIEASAVAVRRHPSLVALRRDVGAAEATLVEAGLLPDPVLGWDAMDAVAGVAIDGKVEDPAWLAGASLTWQVPRPGEIDAREGQARAGIGADAAALARAEWALVRQVHLAYVRRLTADARAAQIERLLGIAREARTYFARARAAGAATALDESLAQVAADSVRADLIAAQLEQAQARLALNALLGLPPAASWVAQDDLDRWPATRPTAPPGPLVDAALAGRPDLRQALAAYDRAEATLALELAGQWPRLQIGTSVSLTLPIFTRFNQPAIRTALQRRAAARARVSALVHAVRADVHAALARAQRAAELLALYDAALGPQTERTLELTERAFAAREVTPLQILTAQRQVLETQARFLDARRAWAEAQVSLDSACGRLLPSAQTPAPATAQEAP